MLDLDLLAGFDLETTGINPHEDRIVSWALRGYSSLVDPRVPIPNGASQVHGITDVMIDFARRHGLVQTPATALGWILTRLSECAQRGEPVVGMNLVYDLTMLQAEARRHDVTVPDALAGLLVVDVYVIDLHYDPVRPGRRRLTDLCRHYLGREHDGAHGALADAEVAAEIFRAQVAAYDLGGPSSSSLTFRALHDSQRHWYAAQREQFARATARFGRPFMYDTCWPACPGGHALQTPAAPTRGGSVPDTPVSWDDIPSRERTRTT